MLFQAPTSTPLNKLSTPHCPSCQPVLTELFVALDIDLIHKEGIVKNTGLMDACNLWQSTGESIFGTGCCTAIVVLSKHVKVYPEENSQYFVCSFRLINSKEVLS